MLKTLIQTIANLGFDSGAISEAFNKAIQTIHEANISTLNGIMNMFTGIVSAFTGVSSADITAIIASLVSSVIGLLSNDATNSILSAITGA